MCKHTPCSECPYRSTSPSGYFGGHDGQEYATAITQETVVACHTRTAYNLNGQAVFGHIHPCMGHLGSQIKSFKVPRDPELQELHNGVKLVGVPDEIMPIWDFIKHHNLG